MSEPSEPNEHRVRTLYAEIDTAAVMVMLVKYTRDPHLARKYNQVALHAYRAALDLILLSSFLPKQEGEVWDHLAPVRQWLEREQLLSA